MSGLLLHDLASVGDSKQLEVLLRVSGKVNVDVADHEYDSRTALHWAAEKGFAGCCRVLLKYDANPLKQMGMGWTPAHCAAAAGNLDVLAVLKQHHHAALVAKDNYGDTPLDIARMYNQTTCEQFLIAQ